MAENLPLAFDILDKTSIQTCPNPMCSHSYSSSVCIQCTILNNNGTNRKPTYPNFSKCNCKTLSAIGDHLLQQQQPTTSSSALGIGNKIGDLNNSQKRPLAQKDLGASLNSTITAMMNQKSSELNGVGSTASNYNVISTRFEEPFHRRECYFSHTKPNRRKDKQQKSCLGIRKTIQFKGGNNGAVLMSKETSKEKDQAKEQVK
jgi:hypothetical protein